LTSLSLVIGELEPMKVVFLVFVVLTTAGSHQQFVTAAAALSLASKLRPMFVVSTGDAIYPDGSTSVADPLFQTRFENVYFGAGSRLAVPWHMTLGNHDCRGNVEAMVEYTFRSRWWSLPSRYYAVDYHLVQANTTIRFVYLDTCALVCAADAPNYRCDQEILKNVERTQAKAQLAWLDRVLGLPADRIVVVGHWSVFSLFGNGLMHHLLTAVMPMQDQLRS
jgi:tartrate-resistant acid phosphatase type 5